MVEFVCLYDGSTAATEKNQECFIFCTWTEIISPEMLNRLSWLSTALLTFCGLLALFVAVYFGYICCRVVIQGRKCKSSLVLNPSQKGLSSRCSQFWMRAVIVAEPEGGKTERRQRKAQRNISLRSLPVRSGAPNAEDEGSCLLTSQSVRAKYRFFVCYTFLPVSNEKTECINPINGSFVNNK